MKNIYKMLEDDSLYQHALKLARSDEEREWLKKTAHDLLKQMSPLLDAAAGVSKDPEKVIQLANELQKIPAQK